MTTDLLRGVVCLITAFDLLLLPRALNVFHRSSRLTLLVLGFDLLMLYVIGSQIDRLHHPVRPFGLPLAGVGVTLVALYIIRALWAQHQGRYNNA